MKVMLFLSALSIFAAASANAETLIDNNGAYAGITVGRSELTESGVDGKVQDSAYRLYLGHQFTPYFGFEMAYGDGGGIDMRIEDISAELHARYFSLSGVGTIPLGDIFSLYGRAGVARWDTKVSGAFGGESEGSTAHGTDFQWAGGGSVRTGPVDLRLEFERTKVDDSDLDLITFGVSWTF